MSTESIQQLIETEAQRIAASRGVQTPQEASIYQVGSLLFIRTVTFYYVGRVTYLDDVEIRLEDASCVIDAGRTSITLKDGNLKEVEPYPFGCSVARASIVDVSPWRHPLPKGK